MRVLWVCNIMLPVIAGKLGLAASNKEGWLSGLAEQVLADQQSNGIELAVAVPVERERDGFRETFTLADQSRITGYGFYEDVCNPEQYDEALEQRIGRIIEDFKPDVIHCFGAEYGHTLAVTRACPRPEKVLVGIQGICSAYARAYMADLPVKVQRSVTFRDLVKRDTLLLQQRKFTTRGVHETEAVHRTGNITGRTHWDHCYAGELNPKAEYYPMNETLRSVFYTGQWSSDTCEKGRIFLSQGDYPVKGLHYMLLALGEIIKTYPHARICVAGNSLVQDRTLKDKIKISAYGRYLKHIIRRNHLEEHVEFLGRLTAEQMKEQYLKAELFVCCSSLENSPNSLGEAMILGTPCVSAAVGGIPTLFRDGVDGILYEGFREDGGEDALTGIAGNLSRAVLQMWSDPAKAAEYGQNARAHAMITHDKAANYRRLLEIYADIANK